MSIWEWGILGTCSVAEPQGICTQLFSLALRLPLGPRPQGIMGVARGAHHTLLRSLAVTPSSSRQGSLCTNASIWYFALMNSDLMGLRGTHRRQWEQSLGELPFRLSPGARGLPTTPSAPLTGLCLVGWLCAGHSVLVQGLAGSAPRWSWPRCWQACEPSVGTRRQAREYLLHAGHWGDTPRVPAAAGNTTKGPTTFLVWLASYLVWPPNAVSCLALHAGLPWWVCQGLKF